MALSIRVHPGKSTQARARAQKMAAKTGQPVSLLQQVTVHGGKYGTGKLRKAWTTYDTVYPSKSNTGRGRRHTRRSNPGGPLDTHAARELELFVENDGDLHRQQGAPINKNLITKMARGVYNHAGAVKLFGYLMESGAKKYIKQHGSVHAYTGRDEWHQVFSPATRKHAAERFADHFEVEAKLGNYDHLLPKKYASWRLKSNPNRLTDVLVKRNGQVFKAKAKYDAKLGRVRIFANPAVARKINPRYGTARTYSTQIDTSRDFHTLSSSEVEQILVEADAQKYRKPKNASGSRARYFYAKLQREAARGRR